MELSVVHTKEKALELRGDPNRPYTPAVYILDKSIHRLGFCDSNKDHFLYLGGPRPCAEKKK